MDEGLQKQGVVSLIERLRDHPEPQEEFEPLYVDTMREAADEIERLYGLAKANNALARLNARRAERAEHKLAEQEGRMEWLSDLLDQARAQKETMYLAKQEAQRAADECKALLLEKKDA